MKLNTSTPTLFALSAIFHLGSSLPFFHRRVVSTEVLVRRATYSVVPVDGGPIPTQEQSAPETTILQTTVETHPPKTKTLVQTDKVTLPPVTDFILTTKTIEGPRTTQTIVITITPSASVATTTKYSLVDVNASTDVPESTISSASISTTSSIIPTQTPSPPVVALPPTTQSSVSSASSPAPPTSASLTASSLSTSISSQAPSPLSSSAITSISLTSSSAAITPTPTPSPPTFDDGHWKTYYPAWSNSTSTSSPVVPVASSSTTVISLPILTPAVVVDSIPHAPGAKAAAATSGPNKRDGKAAPFRRYAPLKIADPWFVRAGKVGAK